MIAAALGLNILSLLPARRRTGDRLMNRRNLTAALGFTALAPGFAWAQARKPVVGVLRVNPRTNDLLFEPFRRDMAALGWVEGKNVELLFTWADGRSDRLPELVAELVARGVDVIVTFGELGTRAAQMATAAIPIVGMTDDLVGSGFVQSMARPGGNVTGISILGTELDPKRLEVLRQTVPQARRIGVLHDPAIAHSLPSVTTAGRALGVELVFASARTGTEVDPAIEALVKARVEAVNVLASPLLNAFRGRQIAEFARARLPAIYEWPETTEQGGLIGYGPRLTACYRQVAGLVDKLLRGARPEDLPVEQPTRIELVINLKTAKELGINVPTSLLARADDVIR
jgi:putative ABC transport system substrate-binding protein